MPNRSALSRLGPVVTGPTAPRGAGAPGRRLWRSVVGQYELEEHELALLVQAVRAVDLCDALRDEVDATGGLTIPSPQGRKANPALVELRAQQITLARLLAALRVPLGEQDADQDEPGHPYPHRGPVRAPRGVYGIRGGAA